MCIIFTLSQIKYNGSFSAVVCIPFKHAAVVGEPAREEGDYALSSDAVVAVDVDCSVHGYSLLLEADVS